MIEIMNVVSGVNMNVTSGESGCGASVIPTDITATDTGMDTTTGGAIGTHMGTIDNR
jgi:hypothetical protein